MILKRNVVIGLVFICFLIVFSGCSSASKSRALVIHCENEKPNEINKTGLKKEMKRENKLDKINTRREKNRK